MTQTQRHEIKINGYAQTQLEISKIKYTVT
jgi:hypothetical protein